MKKKASLRGGNESCLVRREMRVTDSQGQTVGPFIWKSERCFCLSCSSRFVFPAALQDLYSEFTGKVLESSLRLDNLSILPYNSPPGVVIITGFYRKTLLWPFLGKWRLFHWYTYSGVWNAGTNLVLNKMHVCTFETGSFAFQMCLITFICMHQIPTAVLNLLRGLFT